MRSFINRLRANERGALLAEFAIALPVLVLLLLAGVEVSRYALLNQKLDRLATTMGDLVAQAESLTVADINNLFAAAPHVAWPFDVSANGAVIITSVGVTQAAPTQPKINWQKTSGGLTDAVSQIGTVGNATLPTGLVIRSNETIIASEVYFEFQPLFMSAIVPPTRIYHRAFYRPRLAALNSLG